MTCQDSLPHPATKLAAHMCWVMTCSPSSQCKARARDQPHYAQHMCLWMRSCAAWPCAHHGRGWGISRSRVCIGMRRGEGFWEVGASVTGLMCGGMEDLGLACPDIQCLLPAHFLTAQCLKLATPHPVLSCQCSPIPPSETHCTRSSVSVSLTCHTMGSSKPVSIGRNTLLRGLAWPLHCPGTGFWCPVSYLNQVLPVHGHSSMRGGRGGVDLRA